MRINLKKDKPPRFSEFSASVEREAMLAAQKKRAERNKKRMETSNGKMATGQEQEKESAKSTEEEVHGG